MRTYDQPDIEDIMKVYLNNIKQTTSYLYTENQYFRFPPLVREFIAHWESLKNCGRAEGPIHWFTVTNSSDDGIGKGTYTTNEMFKLLGRQEVMPNVAREIRQQELEFELGKRKVNQAVLFNRIMTLPTAEGKAHAQREYRANEQEITRLEKEIADVKAKQREVEKRQEVQRTEGSGDKENKENNKNDETNSELNTIENRELSKEETNLTKALGYEFSDTPGIKAHICTLMPKDENGNYVHRYKDKKGKELPAEVYVHSKVTIMDDVFTVISSANLNTRSMQVDTELGIIMECNEVAEGLRKRLWDLHTNKNGAANPDDMHDYEVAKRAFNMWKDLLESNKRAQNDGTFPDCALREFYRADPTVSRSD
ncbi:phospholipase [Aggregatibacter actinomycetemcomitans]|uniref:Phospholipase n=1 Tax=Aggregatibacter actinomycetemcomitans TaxID=714 RepID=A0A2G1DM01_AGGAC|nr:phospholipase [Aggregatibacter actinomycetemcomitans D7S-1]PHO19542.1 phospholipase [Aggregatibacter actinomycetemcomitans]PHO22918.1 phospholipase [Aggregatibacter actinomycetemcomitans]